MKKLYYVLLALFIVSCNSDSNFEPMMKDLSPTDEFAVSLEDALAQGDKVFNNIYGLTTRSQDRKIESVNLYQPKTLTRSGENFKSYYIVNYENNGGFALLGADMRMESVYAVSDEGSLHLSDTLQNKSLSWYFNQFLPGEYEDKGGGGPTVGGAVPDTIINPEITLTKGLIPYKYTKFHQSAPYNKYCFTPNGEQTVTGCAPLAMGTIMSYYQWPPQLAGVEYDWDAMNSNLNHDLWARLFNQSGIALGVNYRVTYDENTNTYIQSAGLPIDEIHRFIDAFASFRYFDVKIKDFTIESANNQIFFNRPFICTGWYPVYNNNGQLYKEGHAWVIDGYYLENPPYEIVDNAPYRYYYHCIWGWGGVNNGFFLFYNNSLGGYAEELDYGASSIYTPVFPNLKMVYNIVPEN